MKKIILVGSLSSAVLLASCSGDNSSSTTINAVNPDAGATPVSYINFNPAESVVPLPNDLLFSGTTDGTLEVPDEVAAKTAGQAVDFGNPSAAVGAADGWSPIFPMQLSLTMAEGATLDATTVNGDTVKLVETSCQLGGTGCTTAAPTALTYGVDYVAVPGDASITIAPLKPLKAATTYIVGVTTGVLDSRGEAISGSPFYEEVTVDAAVTDLSANATLGAVQAAVNGYEGLVALGATVSPDAFAYTASWTTASVGQGLGGAAQVYFTTPPQLTSLTDLSVTADVAIVAAATAAGADAATIAQLQAVATGLGLGAANLYSAALTLPYFSGHEDDGSDPLNNNWTAACDSPVALAGVLQADQANGTTVFADAAVARAAAPTVNDAICSNIPMPAPFNIPGVLETFRDLGIDTERHITRYNPIPAQRTTNTLAVQITTPSTAAPAAGWPVAIVQHGITSNKEAMLFLTGALSQAGFVTVAIDLPLHGSRSLNSASAGAAVNAGDDVTVYMRLENLPVGRDNLNQSMFDMLGLRTALASGITGLNVDTSQVSFVGMSLGGITGVGFAATAMANATTALDAVALAVPGGGIGPLLIDSVGFGPLVQGSVLAGSGTDLGNEFLAFIGADSANCLGDIGCNFTAFSSGLDATGLAIIEALLTQFAFAAQTIIDPADPINFAGGLALTGVPIYLSEVVGDGVNNLPDQVIPRQSSVGGLSFGGTEPLASYLGLQPGVDADNSGAASGIVRFTEGSHGSLLSPEASQAATAEMQAQIAAFLLGAGVTITDSTVVVDLP